MGKTQDLFEVRKQQFMKRRSNLQSLAPSSNLFSNYHTNNVSLKNEIIKTQHSVTQSITPLFNDAATLCGTFMTLTAVFALCLNKIRESKIVRAMRSVFYQRKQQRQNLTQIMQDGLIDPHTQPHSLLYNGNVTTLNPENINLQQQNIPSLSITCSNTKTKMQEKGGKLSHNTARVDEIW
jgi:hypothetical protein